MDINIYMLFNNTFLIRSFLYNQTDKTCKYKKSTSATQIIQK